MPGQSSTNGSTATGADRAQPPRAARPAPTLSEYSRDISERTQEVVRALAGTSRLTACAILDMAKAMVTEQRWRGF